MVSVNICRGNQLITKSVRHDAALRARETFAGHLAKPKVQGLVDIRTQVLQEPMYCVLIFCRVKGPWVKLSLARKRFKACFSGPGALLPGRFGSPMARALTLPLWTRVVLKGQPFASP